MSSCGQQVDPLLELFRSRGHYLKREGNCYKTRCPFHQDDTPSLSVEPAKGLWHCFGCGIGGDGITFLEKTLGLDFGQAADQWRELSGEEPKYRSASDRSPSPYLYKDNLTMNRFAAAQPSNGTHSAPPHSMPTGLTSEDLALFRRLQDIYAKDLATSEKGRAYLKERGITDPETIRAFGLGYVSGSSLPQMSKAQTRRLQDLGILNSKGNEAFYNCIVCPLHDVEGNIITFWARSCATAGSPCGRRQVEKGSRHRCLPAQENAPFAAINWQAARGSRRVILVEGFLDALACYQAGIRNVIPLGAAHAKLGFAQFLHREGVEEVLLAMDPDEAGDEGAQALAEELEHRGIGSVRVRLDVDPADFFLQGGTATAFQATPTEILGQRSDDSEFILDSHNLIYRVRVLAGRQVEGKLKVQVLVTDGNRTHRDTLNLYTHKSRKTFANAVASRFTALFNSLSAGADDVEKDLEAIIHGLEERERQKEETTDENEPVILSPAEQAEAETYLKEPGLVRRLQDDMEALGYVGEEEAKLLVYLIATSRLLPRPLSGIIGSGSGAGKSFLAELAEQLTPPEDVILFSKLSPQALYYLPEDFLSGKLLILEERAGGEGADYAIRTLQSKDCLTQIVTLKDMETGQMAAKRFTVRGPIAYLETTTQSYLNQENTSRCFEIPLDESADQTLRIHQHQRRARSLWGLKRNISKDIIRRRHHNLQRVLQPVRVVIPYAEHLTFPAASVRTRRDHERFLSLIEAVAFLHQFQRVTRTASHKGKEVKYIEATVEDYAIAYHLALRVLWVSLDELSRWSRELVESCRRQVEEGVAHNPELTANDFHWTRRQLRERLGWPDKRLRACVDELVSLEYFQTLDGSKGKAYLYRLNPNFSHSPKAIGLLTPDELEAKLSCASVGYPPRAGADGRRQDDGIDAPDP